MQSERPATSNNNGKTAERYAADVAPSILLWLVGPKDCVEVSIPELGELFCNSVLGKKLTLKINDDLKKIKKRK